MGSSISWQDTLSESRRGGRGAAERLMLAVYEQLRSLAAAQLRRERPGHTLHPTELVHEAYMRLAEIDQIDWQGRTHFLAMASTQMRRILVEHARRSGTSKRGGAWRRVTLAEIGADQEHDIVHVLAIDEALDALAAEHPRQARVAQMRLFSGMTMEEMAAELDVSTRTVKSDWRLARAWMSRALGGTLRAGSTGHAAPAPSSSAPDPRRGESGARRSEPGA